MIKTESIKVSQEEKYNGKIQCTHPRSLQKEKEYNNESHRNTVEFWKISWHLTLNQYDCVLDQLSDIDEDELVDILKPNCNKRKAISPSPNKNLNEIIITTTQKEMNDLNGIEQQQIQAPTARTKTEKQRLKNLKLKFKQKTRPEFQNKIKRPIYKAYDFRKIRTQLNDDQMYTSHWITINRQREEVLIGHRSIQEADEARAKLPINLFL